MRSIGEVRRALSLLVAGYGGDLTGPNAPDAGVVDSAIDELADLRQRVEKAEEEAERLREAMKGGGLCASDQCEGHCGYSAMRGCAAIRAYLKEGA